MFNSKHWSVHGSVCLLLMSCVISTAADCATAEPLTGLVTEAGVGFHATGINYWDDGNYRYKGGSDVGPVTSLHVGMYFNQSWFLYGVREDYWMSDNRLFYRHPTAVDLSFTGVAARYEIASHYSAVQPRWFISGQLGRASLDAPFNHGFVNGQGMALSGAFSTKSHRLSSEFRMTLGRLDSDLSGVEIMTLSTTLGVRYSW